MRKNIITFLILIFLISCNQSKNNGSQHAISFRVIDSLSNETVRYANTRKINKFIYIKYINKTVYAKVSVNHFVSTSSIELYRIYIKKHKNKISQFNVFLNDVLNNNFILDKNDFYEKPFSLDNVVNKRFNEFEIKYFINYYSVKDASENQIYLNKKIKTENEYLTISYLLFTKGYYLGEDDLRGRSYIYKFDDMMKK